MHFPVVVYRRYRSSPEIFIPFYMLDMVHLWSVWRCGFKGVNGDGGRDLWRNIYIFSFRCIFVPFEISLATATDYRSILEIGIP